MTPTSASPPPTHPSRSWVVRLTSSWSPSAWSPRVSPNPHVHSGIWPSSVKSPFMPHRRRQCAANDQPPQGAKHLTSVQCHTVLLLFSGIAAASLPKVARSPKAPIAGSVRPPRQRTDGPSPLTAGDFHNRHRADVSEASCVPTSLQTEVLNLWGIRRRTATPANSS